MEMHQIRYFLAVAEDLNFTRAAARCNVAQPSLTRAVKLLEIELGGALFHRERSNTHLTELGRMVKPYMEQVLAGTQMTRTVAEGYRNPKRAKLRLGVMCTIMPNAMIGLISAMRVRYPGIRVEIIDATAPDLLSRLISGELEVGLLCQMKGSEDERLFALPLFEEPMMVVMHPDHRLAGKASVTVADLNGERYLQRMNCEVAPFIERLFTERGMDDDTICKSERDDWILAMTAAGMGYSCMARSCVVHAGVVARPLDQPPVLRGVDLVTVRGRPHSPAVGALVREAMQTDWLGQTALAVRRVEMERDAEAR